MEILHPGQGVTDSMKNHIAQGYFFEQCVTGKRPGFREAPQQEVYLSYLSRAHKVTLARIQSYGAQLHDIYLTEPYETGVWLEYEFPEFILNGEVDVKMGSKIIDVKYLASIHEVLDPDGRLFVTEYMLQPPTYALLQILQDDSVDHHLLYQAADHYIRNERKLYANPLNEWIKQMIDKDVPRCFFLACDNKEVNEERNVVEDETSWGLPLHQFLEVEVSLHEYMFVLAGYMSVARAVNKMVIANNVFSESLLTQIDPNERRCLGKNVTGKHGGYCQYIGSCSYGQTLYNRQTISFESIWNSD